MSTPKKMITIDLQMQIDNAAFLRIAKTAHSKNETFNQTVNRLLMEAVDRETQTVPAPATSFLRHQ